MALTLQERHASILNRLHVDRKGGLKIRGIQQWLDDIYMALESVIETQQEPLGRVLMNEILEVLPLSQNQAPF